MANEYCTVDDVVALVGDDDARRNALSTIITDVSRSIDRECRRVFFSVQDARLYDWPERGVLRLRDDLISVTSITTNAGQSLTASDVHLRPQGGPPFFEIVPATGVTFQYETTPLDAITVLGTWGYQTTVPYPIRMAAKLWAADIYARAETPAMNKMSSGEINFMLIPAVDKPPAAAMTYIKKFIKRRVYAVSTASRNVSVLG